MVMNNVNLQEMQQLKQIEEMKKQILNKILTKEAFERLARVRIANLQLASQAELYLLQLYQSGKIQEKITDDKLKDVLRVLSAPKEINIKRR
jgi:programmed cell death protein 5